MKIGQKVICIYDLEQNDPYPEVKKGEVYIIRGFSLHSTGLYLEGLYLDFIKPGVERAFLRKRFREIDQRFGEDVLEGIFGKMVEEEVLEYV